MTAGPYIQTLHNSREESNK